MSMYKKYENTKPVAVKSISNFGGIEILDIIYGINDYIVACFNFETDRQQIRQHKICETSAGRSYFWKNHTRYYLDDFMRI